MELSFNHFKNVQDVDCYLCNPDRSLLSVIPARARNFILRFNTLSEFTCEVPKYVSNAEGDLYEHPYYDYIQTRRLINVDKIGWFKIVEAVETDSGNGASKSIRAESCESTFKEVGFAIENRVYKFYDELDEEDESYNPLNEEAMPSVVGQLYKQLGIRCDLRVGDITPTVDYGDWTIIWIEDDLKYSTSKDTNICRTLNENVESFGYDFMTSDVSQAFQVFFEFDFAHHAIKVKSTSKVAEKTDIYLSFDNVMKELSTTENSQDIVTVLTCEGTNLGINSVNPMGTNYICDFSYYMGSDENGYPWMSKALTDKINAWKKTVSDNEDSYAGLVENLQELYEKKTALESKKTLIDKEVFVIKKAADDYAANPNVATSPVDVEIVKTGEYSLATDSVFANSAFKDDVEISGGWKVYEKAPIYIDGAYAYKSREGNEYKPLASGDTLSDCFSLIGIPTKDLYFSDGDTQSYCELLQGTAIDKTDPENPNATYFVDGFTRFAPYSRAGIWQSTRENEQRTVDTEIKKIEGDEKEPEENTINYILTEMKAISDECNILSFFSGADNANLLKELRCYWVDGKYTNDTLKGLDGDTVAENLSLSKELMDTGKVELARVAQPRFSFTVTSANFLKMPQFTKFAEQLAMGKVVTVEKNEDTRYNASLTEMSFSLDESDTFSLTFSNSLKLTDWGFTYADLFKSVSDTSRAVQANWTNLMEYSQEKETISNLLINSLDRTLRAGLDNSYNQEFIVDTSGILGRKFNNGNTAYENEQLRIINNVIMFTNDNWQTASAVLGKITYVDPDTEEETTRYGLIADSIIGRLFVGEHLWIGDTNGYVTINGKGIEICDEDGNAVFTANKDKLAFVSGYTKSDDFSKFLDEYAREIEGLQGQITDKAETWYQADDPSTSWDSDEKTAHSGDLWYDTSTGTSKTWDGGKWVEQDIPSSIRNEIFDYVDGKAQIFYEQPKGPYFVGDLWVKVVKETKTVDGKTTTINNTTTILKCKTENTTENAYNENDWDEVNTMTDNSRAEQLYESITVENGIIDLKVGDAISEVEGKLSLEIVEENGEKISKLSANTRQICFDTGQLIIDADNFVLTEDGTVTCKNITIDGGIIKSSGFIAGENGAIFSLGDNPYLQFPNFSVDAYGNITATGGTIANFSIEEDYLYNEVNEETAVLACGSFFGYKTSCVGLGIMDSLYDESNMNSSYGSMGMACSLVAVYDDDYGSFIRMHTGTNHLTISNGHISMQALSISNSPAADEDGSSPASIGLHHINGVSISSDNGIYLKDTIYIGTNKKQLGGMSYELSNNISAIKVFPLGDIVVISYNYGLSVAEDACINATGFSSHIKSVYSVIATAKSSTKPEFSRGPILVDLVKENGVWNGGINFWNDAGAIDGFYAIIIGEPL